MRPVNWRLRLSMMNNELDRLDEYVRLLAGVLMTEQARLNAAIEQEMKDLSEEDREWWPKEMRGSEIAHVTEHLPRTMWYGAFISQMSYVDHALLDLARTHHAKVKHWEPAELVPGYDAMRYKDDTIRYWKAVGFAFPDAGGDWAEILLFYDLRNVIAHEGGELDGSPRSAKIRQYVSGRNTNSLAIDTSFYAPTGALVLTEDFCHEAVGVVRRFFNGVVPSLPRHPRAATGTP
ncbi:MAG: hypothetical protein JWO38_5052 [Gemmataceae bacterium]|nr:hypothetical protein [Gemmataceae bacterium]